MRYRGVLTPNDPSFLTRKTRWKSSGKEAREASERLKKRNNYMEYSIDVETCPAEANPWIQTYTGGRFHPLRPDPKEVKIEDIAHALSLICRFNGHCVYHYSVAQHSVLLFWYIQKMHPDKPDLWLWALLHDAAEAYVSDVTRPVKECLTLFQKIEQRVMKAICEKFGMNEGEPAEVKQADAAILADERDQLMAPPPADWCVPEPLGVEIHPMQPSTVKKLFLECFKEIMEYT